MKQDIKSPLVPMVVPGNGQMNVWSSLGVVCDLCINHGGYHNFTIDQLLARVVPALQNSQAQIFFDPEHRPIGFASWIVAPNKLHSNFLNDPRLVDAHDLFSNQRTAEVSHLWFVDLIAPFSSLLGILQPLKAKFPDFTEAWALTGHASARSPQPRRIW